MDRIQPTPESCGETIDGHFAAIISLAAMLINSASCPEATAAWIEVGEFMKIIGGHGSHFTSTSGIGERLGLLATDRANEGKSLSDLLMMASPILAEEISAVRAEVAQERATKLGGLPQVRSSADYRNRN